MKKITLFFLGFFLRTKHENVTEFKNLQKNCKILNLIEKRKGFYYYRAKYTLPIVGELGLELTIKSEVILPIGEIQVNENLYLKSIVVEEKTFIG